MENYQNMQFNNNIDNTLFRTEYKYIIPDYYDLPEFDESPDYLNLMRKISNSIVEFSHSHISLNIALNELRRVRKYSSDLFESIFNSYQTEMSNMILSAQVSVSKTAMRLLIEIFLYNEESDSLMIWIKNFVPCLLMKSISEVGSVKEEANSVLFNFVDNMLYPSTFEILLEGSLNSNVSISNVSFEYLVIFLKNLENHFIRTLYDQLDWHETLLTIINLHEMKKEAYITKAYKLISFLDNSFRTLYCIDKLNNILIEINDEDFHIRFNAMCVQKMKWDQIQTNKMNLQVNIKTSRQSIKSDKCKIKSNSLRMDGELQDENYDSNRYSNSQSNTNNGNFYSVIDGHSYYFNQK